MVNRTAEFQAIHEAYRPKLTRYLTRMVGSASAEDLMQQVFLKISQGLEGFRGEAELSTWIYCVATNAALDHLRSSELPRQRTDASPTLAGDDQGTTEGDSALTPEVASTETLAIRGEMSACIREFVERLPPDYKSVIVLSELEGFANREIAGILGVSLGTVKIRLHRARERLRQDLTAGCEFYRDERNELACDRKP